MNLSADIDEPQCRFERLAITKTHFADVPPSDESSMAQPTKEVEAVRAGLNRRRRWKDTTISAAATANGRVEGHEKGCPESQLPSFNGSAVATPMGKTWRQGAVGFTRNER